MARLRIDVWSDIACPWCYVGKRRLEAALGLFPHRAEVEVVWRAFELDPTAPPEKDLSLSYAARLAKKYGSSVREAEARIVQLTETARADGLDFRFDQIRPGNTFDAHRLLHLARERGIQDAVKERFLRAYMTEGEPIGRRDALVRLGTEVGLDPAEASDALERGLFSDQVRADEQEAHTLGVSGVPCFVLAQRYAVSGAQPAKHLLQALDQAWTALASSPLVFAEGAACGPEGCA